MIPEVTTLESHRPNIAFAGLTAAGKTTHAKILAEQLGYEYLSATQTILDILSMKNNPDNVWFTNYDEIERAREGDAVDIELEARMTNLANNKDGLVLDTWAMAWIYNGPNPMIRVWIESDEASRTRKCLVSQGADPELDLDGCRDLVNQKDTDTAVKFTRRLGFDLFNDRERYDLILNNTALIPEATETSSKIGISTFAPIVLAAVRYCIHKSFDSDFDNSRTQANELMNHSNGMINVIR